MSRKSDEVQAQGGGEVAGILRTAFEYHRAQATGPCDQFGNKASRRNLKLEAWHRQVADAIEAITTPPSAPVGADAVLRDALQGLIDFIEIDNLPMDADAMFIAKRAVARKPAPSAPVGVEFRYVDITSPGYEGWINLFWGNEVLARVEPPVATEIRAALAQQPAAECSASPTGKHSEHEAEGTSGWCEWCSTRMDAQQPAADTVTVQQAWEWAGGNPGINATREGLEKALRDLDAVCDDADRQPAAVDGAATGSAVAAIQFALSDPEGMTFLRLWNEGEFDTLRREWPDAPVEVYVGSDPLAAQLGDTQ